MAGKIRVALATSCGVSPPRPAIIRLNSSPDTSYDDHKNRPPRHRRHIPRRSHPLLRKRPRTQLRRPRGSGIPESPHRVLRRRRRPPRTARTHLRRQPDRQVSRKEPAGGIHHIAFATDDIDGQLAQAKDKGARLIHEVPFEGAADKLVAFLHPKSTFGVLTEFCQPAHRPNPSF